VNRNRGIDFLADANGAGRDGFTDGDPGADPVVNASEYSSEQANGVQEEIVRAIELLDGTPSYADNEQLGTLLVGLFDGTGSLPTPVTRTITIPASAFNERTGTWTASSNGEILTASTAAATIGGDLGAFLPNGCTVLTLRALVDPGAGNTMEIDISKRTLDFVTPGIGSQVFIAEDYPSSGASLQSIYIDAAGWAGEVVSKSSGEILMFTLTAGAANVNPDIFYGVQLTVMDTFPGQR
jgi:hypothetical protein